MASGAKKARRATAEVPDESVFASLELFAADGGVCFAAGDCAEAIGFEPREADSDVLHPQAWLVAAAARAQRHAARAVRAQAAGDFTRHYVSIDSVDLSNSSDDEEDDDEKDDEEDDDEKDDEDDDDEDEDEDGEESDSGTRGSKGRQHSSARRRETVASAEEEERRQAHDQYDLIALMAAREERERKAGAPDPKRARSDDDVTGAAVSAEPESANLWPQTRRSALLDSMLAGTPCDVAAVPAAIATADEEVVKEEDNSTEALVPAMPPIGESLAGDTDALRETRRRRHEKTLRCEVAARVQELLMPYYKARRFANKVWGSQHSGTRVAVHHTHTHCDRNRTRSSPSA